MVECVKNDVSDPAIYERMMELGYVFVIRHGKDAVFTYNKWNQNG